MKSIKEIAYYFHMYSNKNTQIFNLHNDTRKLKKHLNRLKRIINSSNFKEIEIILKIKEP